MANTIKVTLDYEGRTYEMQGTFPTHEGEHAIDAAARISGAVNMKLLELLRAEPATAAGEAIVEGEPEVTP